MTEQVIAYADGLAMGAVARGQNARLAFTYTEEGSRILEPRLWITS